MPAKSKAQQKFMAICLHNPAKSYKKSCPPKSVAKDFAETKLKGLPNKVKKR